MGKNYSIPEIDNYLDAFGTFGAYKSEPDEPTILPKKGRTLKLRDHDFRIKAKRDERAKNLAKKAKEARSWTRAELENPDGTATRYYLWDVHEREDGWHLNIKRQTERHDAIRVRKANGKIAEIEKEGKAVS